MTHVTNVDDKSVLCREERKEIMGYMRHHGILITGFDKERVQVAHQKAREIFDETLVSEIKESVINGYYSFAIFPDGSKEGWTDSDRGDQNRVEFIAWLQAQLYEDKSSPYDWVLVQYGDDELETCVVSDSDQWRREERIDE
jgi:hypothetical protein